MRKAIALLLGLVVFAVLANPAFAQAQSAKPTGPPAVLQIFREEVKPGKAIAHEKHEVAWTQAFVRAKFPAHFLALSSMSGATENWFISGYESFAAFEKESKQIEAMPAVTNILQQFVPAESDFLASSRTVVARFRDDLSYRPNIEIGKMRYFRIDTVRVRPGHDEDFVELRKIVNAAHEKANIDEHWAVYQVVGGAPSGTYLVFLPFRDMAVVDEAPKVHGQAYRDAVGDEGRKKLRELSSAAIIVTESNTYSISPKMSYVSETTMAADPEFWKPRAQVAKTAAPKEGAPTKTTTPAAKKEAKKGN